MSFRYLVAAIAVIFVSSDQVSLAEEVSAPSLPANPLRLQLPTAPEGYGSRPAIIAAIGLGQLKLIDPKESELPPGVREVKDIEYGKVGDRALQLDLALPTATTDRKVPGLIFIHGGAWSGGERTVYHYYTRRFAAMGFAAATISYRLSGEAPYPAAVEDAKCAVRWMRSHADEYHIDAERLAVIGGSAGGHLSMMVGYCDLPELEGSGGWASTSSRVAAVVNFYGPVDLTTEEGQRASPVKKFLGGTYDERPDVYRQASPLYSLDAADPPTLVIHGTLDETVSIAQADMLAKRLDEVKVPYAYQRMEGWPHTLDAVQVTNDHCRQLMQLFFAKFLDAQPPAAP